MGYFPISDSNSIVSQKAILSKYAADNGFSSPVFFVDGGVSGVAFDGPNFNRMVAKAEAGNMVTIIVRDMSRLECDYLKASHCTEIFSAERNVHCTAVNDDVDGARGDSDFTPFCNLFSGLYAKDTGKRMQVIKRTQDMVGEYLTKSPCGHIINPTDKKQWIVDEEAAAVVRWIFDLCINRRGPIQIAKVSKADSAPIAKAYYTEKKRKTPSGSPHNQKDSSIVGILEHTNCYGHTVNSKSHPKSHKLKKWIPTTKKQQAVLCNTHEVIVKDVVPKQVQELRTNKHRPTKAERQDLFSGLMYYVDYGSKLHFATCKSLSGSRDRYHCTKYESNAGSCMVYFIREEVLKQIVWGRVFDVTVLFFDDIMAFREMICQQRSVETEEEMKRKKRRAGQAQKRIAGLDRILKRVYEDDIRDAISHERLLKLPAEYGTEQWEMEERVKSEQQEVDICEQNRSDFDSFSAIIRKYVGIKEPTLTVINEFIEEIVIHAPEKMDGKRAQKVGIIFNFAGEVNFLSATLPERQGAQEREETVQPLQLGLYHLI